MFEIKVLNGVIVERKKIYITSLEELEELFNLCNDYILEGADMVQLDLVYITIGNGKFNRERESIYTINNDVKILPKLSLNTLLILSECIYPNKYVETPTGLLELCNYSLKELQATIKNFRKCLLSGLYFEGDTEIIPFTQFLYKLGYKFERVEDKIEHYLNRNSSIDTSEKAIK